MITDGLLADEADSYTTATTTNMNRKNMQRISDKVVFNDGTAAGVLSNLKGCTRTMHLHEADVTMKSLGLMLPSPADITPTRVDSFRSTLMTLHENPGGFVRVLKNEKIDISGSKLNIFGASTGDLIAAELVRQAASLTTDALFERFILWPIDGEPIPNEDCIPSIDFTQYPSLEQFGVMCGFFADLTLDLQEEGKTILAQQAFNFRVAGTQDGVQDNIAARLNKTALVCYRVTGLSGVIEAAFDLVHDYIQEFVTFGNGEADEPFVNRASKIAEHKYGSVLRKEQRLVIDVDTCKRGHDVTVKNLAQYMALMKIQDEDKNNWFGRSGRGVKGVLRFIAAEETNDVVELKSSNPALINNGKKINLPLTRKQQNMLQDANRHKVSILLHPSLVFLKSNLYTNSSLKKTSSILEASFLQPLVTEGYLTAVPNGLICQKSKASIYVKMIPDDEASKEKFSQLLASFHDARLNYQTYLESCKTISLHTAGVISAKVLETLQRECYQKLDIDFSSLFQRVENENQRERRNRTFSMSTEANQSIDSGSIIERNQDNNSIDEQQDPEKLEYHEISNNNSVDISSEINDQSNASVTHLIVVNEEIVEEESVVDNGQTEWITKIPSKKRSNKPSGGEEQVEEQLLDNESFSETIAERIRTCRRKRVKKK